MVSTVSVGLGSSCPCSRSPHGRKRRKSQRALEPLHARPGQQGNPRKEFFRVGINEIMEHVESTCIQAHWTLTARAASFRESQRIEQSLLGNTEEGQRWAEIQSEAVEVEELIL